MSDTMIQAFGEFFGTCILVLLGDGIVAGVSLNKTKSNGAGWVAVTFAWGFAVTIAVFLSGFMTPGAHLNPAVTIGVAMAGNFEWSMVVPFIIAQMLGGILGAVLVWLHYYPHWEATKDPATILGVFSTAPAIRHTWSNLLGEIIGTFVLVYGILAFGYNTFADGLNPIVVGILIIVIGLSLGGTTGYAINPARDLGPRIAHFILPIANKGDSDWGYSWIPVVGPIIGGIIAALIYGMFPVL